MRKSITLCILWTIGLAYCMYKLALISKSALIIGGILSVIGVMLHMEIDSTLDEIDDLKADLLGLTDLDYVCCLRDGEECFIQNDSDADLPVILANQNGDEQEVSVGSHDHMTITSRGGNIILYTVAPQKFFAKSGEMDEAACKGNYNLFYH